VTPRPQHRELQRKINEAKIALRNGYGIFANPAKAVGELNALQIGDTSVIWELIQSLLEEIEPDDYVGGKPPLRSYEKRIEGRELFAFSWWSKTLGHPTYLKFAMKGNCYYYVSLHKDRAKKQKGVKSHEMLTV